MPRKRNEKTCGGGLVGLQNHGNTCYMNSVLQCLLHVPDFYLFYSNLNVSKKVANLSQSVGNLCRSSSSSPIYEIIQAVKHYNPEFCNGYQQDAFEFLLFFIDVLRDEMPCSHEMFEGIQRNLLICSSCNSVSDDQPETFLTISVPLECTDVQNVENKRRKKDFFYTLNGGIYRRENIPTLENCKISDLKKKLPHQEKHFFQFLETNHFGFVKLLQDDTSIDEVGHNSTIYAVHLEHKSSTSSDISLIYINFSCNQQQEFSETTEKPKIAFISCGENTKILHPTVIKNGLRRCENGRRPSQLYLCDNLQNSEIKMAKEIPVDLRVNRERIILVHAYWLSSDYDYKPTTKQVKGSLDLDSCLSQFLMPSRIDGSPPSKCNSCNQVTEVLDKVVLQKLPKYLIVQLMRFSEDLTTKNTTFVDFPIENFDLSKYFHNGSADEEYLYDLIGVSNHYGSLHGGHYTAYAKVAEKFYNFNDTYVSDCFGSVVSNDAYILFYQRKSELNEKFQELRISSESELKLCKEKIKNNATTTKYQKTKHGEGYLGAAKLTPVEDEYEIAPVHESWAAKQTIPHNETEEKNRELLANKSTSSAKQFAAKGRMTSQDRSTKGRHGELLVNESESSDKQVVPEGRMTSQDRSTKGRHEEFLVNESESSDKQVVAENRMTSQDSSTKGRHEEFSASKSESNAKQVVSKDKRTSLDRSTKRRHGELLSIESESSAKQVAAEGRMTSQNRSTTARNGESKSLAKQEVAQCRVTSQDGETEDEKTAQNLFSTSVNAAPEDIITAEDEYDEKKNPKSTSRKRGWLSRLNPLNWLQSKRKKLDDTNYAEENAGLDAECYNAKPKQKNQPSTKQKNKRWYKSKKNKRKT